MRVGDVPVAPISRAEICSIVVDDCRDRRQADGDGRRARLLFSANGHTLYLAAKDPAFRAALDQADLIHADGQALVFASRCVGGGGIPERSATTDLIHDISPLCPAQGLSFFLLGGTEDVSSRCAETLTRLYPGLEIAGRRNGYFTEEQEGEICEEISASRADILWVGLGKPAEQLFCARNRERLDVGWAITCGGTFRFVVGDYRRAPLWMQAAGLEWLFRVFSSPRRLLWRYVKTNPYALFLLATKTRRQATNRGGAPVDPWYRGPRQDDPDPDDGRR